MYQKKKKLYVLGIALFCGLLLLSVDDCEDMSMVEREQYARALREKNDTALAARMEREQALQAEREKAGADQAARTRAEQERNAAANTPRQQAPQAAQSQSSAQPAAQPASSAGTGAASGTAGARPVQTAAAENQPAAQPTGRGTAAQNTAAGGAAAAPQESAAQADSNGANYVSSIAGKSWKLTELRFTDKTVILNRGELSGEEADIFTLAVDNERISGKGAPNRYFTPYQAGANNALTLRPIAGTMMAAIITNPLRIREPDYFQYLAKVTSWKLNQNKLELNSLDKTNKELVLVFSN